MRRFATVTFCASPVEVLYCMPPKMREITAIIPNDNDSRLIVGLIYLPTKSQLSFVQFLVETAGSTHSLFLAHGEVGLVSGALSSSGVVAAASSLFISFCLSLKSSHSDFSFSLNLAS